MRAPAARRPGGGRPGRGGLAGAGSGGRRPAPAAVAALGLALAAALPPAAPAQVKGLTPTSQYFDWRHVDGGPLAIWYSVPRRGADRGPRAADSKALAHRAAEVLKPVYDRLAEVFGMAPGHIGVSVSGVLPADRTQLRFEPSRGGITLYQAPADRAVIGTDEWLRRAGAPQIAQAFLWHALNQRRLKDPVRRYLLRRLPPSWLLLGLAAHLAHPPVPADLRLLRASLDGRDPLPMDDLLFAPSLRQLRKEEAFQQARSFAGFLYETRGIAPCLAFLDELRPRPTRPGKAFERAFGETMGETRNRWLAATRAALSEAADGPPPAEARLVTALPGWLGGLDLSPGDDRFATLLNRRFATGSFMDLNLIERFGEKEPRFLGGDPVVGAPAWVDGDRVAVIEESVRPFGLRLQRITVRPVAHQDSALQRVRGLRGSLEIAARTARRLTRRTFGGGQPAVLYEGSPLTAVAADGAGRRLAAIEWAAGDPQLLEFDLAGWRPGAPPPAPTRTPAPGAYGLRYSQDGAALFVLRRAGRGSQLARRPAGGGPAETLLDQPGPITGVFEADGRVFFVVDTASGGGALYEHREGEPPVAVLADPGGVLYPTPAEGARWVAYGRLGPEGFELVEAPLPSPWRPDLAGPVTAAPWDPGEPPETLELTLADRPYRQRFAKRRDRYIVDEDTVGMTFEWRDPFNYRAIQAAAWYGNEEPDGLRWQGLYYLNRTRPSVFFGAFHADREDLLGMFQLSNFNAAATQRGVLAGINLQATPYDDLTLLLEHKTLRYNPVVFAGRLPGFDPETNLVRLRWTRNQLNSESTDATSPIGERWLSMSLARSAFGGDADYWELLGDWRTYLPLERASDSIATRLVFGFRNPDQDPAPVPLDFTIGGPESLRGIRADRLAGERMAVASFELRRQLTDQRRLEKTVDRLGLTPVFDPVRFNRVYAALFFDMGTAYTGGFEWGRVERGVGIELRAQGQLTALRPLTLRLGFAHGFGPLGVNDIYLVTTGTF